MDPTQNSIQLKNKPPYNLVFSSSNDHKIGEVHAFLGQDFNLVGLKDIGLFDDIEETGKSFQENAQIKAEYVFHRTGLDVFADDSGLEIEALGGAPGIFSARYSENRNFKENVKKVLKELSGIKNRKAQFQTCICLFYKGEIGYFTGLIHGEILEDGQGQQGFGYDPIFKPLGYSLSFAQMEPELKNQISHRALALKNMRSWIENYSCSPISGF